MSAALLLSLFTATAVAAMIEGTEGDDDLLGTAEADTIVGKGGDDFIDAGEGDDTARGESGKDSLTGRRGDDILEGGEGDDIAFGRDGDDTVIGGPGRDDLGGQRGDDTVRGGSGADVIIDSGGADKLSGGPGLDLIRAWRPDDSTARGGDLVLGRGGPDRIRVNNGQADTVDCGPARDRVAVDRNGLDNVRDCEAVEVRRPRVRDNGVNQQPGR